MSDMHNHVTCLDANSPTQVICKSNMHVYVIACMCPMAKHVCYMQVLYNSLPVMLESCTEEHLAEGRGGKPIVIGEAVEFLQALLDMMNDQHLHLEVTISVTGRDVVGVGL